MSASSRKLVLPFFLLLLVQFSLILCTFQDYGITYDEEWHSTYGEYILQWHLSGYQDGRALSYWTLPLQGGFSAAAARLATHVSPLGDFETIHLVNAFFGLLGVVGVYKLGTLLSGPVAGICAALFLLATPRYYGHSFNNLIDIPMAALTILFLYYLVKMISYLPEISKRDLIKIGVVLGLALAVRIGAVILMVYMAAGLCLWLLSRHISKGRESVEKEGLSADMFTASAVFFSSCFIAYFIMLLWWPAAQLKPVMQPLRGLKYATHFGYSIDVLFEGETISNVDVPWYYVTKWLLVTLPEFYFISMVIGLLLLLRYVLKHRQRMLEGGDVRTVGIAVLAVAAAMPILYTVITNPVEYDGIRHYLFVLPPLAVLCAISFASLLQKAPRSFTAIIIGTSVFVSVGMTAVDMISLHPYQYVFFNRLFGGGVARAAESFETDYWGSSYKEGVAWLSEHYPGKDDGTKIRVGSCLYPLSTSYYLPRDRFDYLGSYEDAETEADIVVPDILLATTRWDCHKTFKGEILHTVSRKGVPLLYVIEVSGESNTSPEDVITEVSNDKSP